MKKYMTPEDRILWGRVARSTRPMPGRAIEDLDIELEDFAALLDPPVATAKKKVVAEPPVPVQPTPQPKRFQPGNHIIDAPTRQKIVKGRLPIEGKVDLHGMTQSEAHSLLLSFLHRAYADGRRHVLVVTGKGSTSQGDGVLKRAVPSWFSTAPFRLLVSGHEQAARHHGGEGALYVRIRRQVAP
jgi:DNA-nicking Smr family endonuclease